MVAVYIYVCRLRRECLYYPSLVEDMDSDSCRSMRTACMQRTMDDLGEDTEIVSLKVDNLIGCYK